MWFTLLIPCSIIYSRCCLHLQKTKTNVVFIKKKKNSVTPWAYADNSNKRLIYSYTFLCKIIFLTYRKIYFHLYIIGKKNLLCKIIHFHLSYNLPEDNLWFYYYQRWDFDVMKRIEIDRSSLFMLWSWKERSDRLLLILRDQRVQLQPG